jgi:hypothetical protein
MTRSASLRVVGVALALTFLNGCVSVSEKGSQVRVTSNPDAVRGCQFLGNVKATSGWGGSAGTGLAGSNTEKSLQNKTADLGGNVLFVVSSGIHASGEAYRCQTSPVPTPAP